MCTHPLKRNSVHCAGCHEDFGGVSGFDSHQRFAPFRCLPPPYPGLTQDGDGVWRRPRPQGGTGSRNQGLTATGEGSDLEPYLFGADDDADLTEVDGRAIADVMGALEHGIDPI